MQIFMIVAMAENRVIGKNNQLPWRLPADLRRFKTLTWGKPIVMGRKTYDSIGKPLPGRLNIIVTRDQHFNATGCAIAHTLQQAFQLAAEQNDTCFVIGGNEIYQQALPYASRIYLTIVHHLFEGDVTFPELNLNEWEEKECIKHEADTEHAYPYSFLLLQRRRALAKDKVFPTAHRLSGA